MMAYMPATKTLTMVNAIPNKPQANIKLLFLLSFNVRFLNAINANNAMRIPTL